MADANDPTPFFPPVFNKSIDFIMPGRRVDNTPSTSPDPPPLFSNLPRIGGADIHVQIDSIAQHIAAIEQHLRERG